jgi:transposase
MTTTFIPDLIESPLASGERVDDLPLLLAHLRNMRMHHLLDTALAGRAGIQSLSPGWVATLWIAHMLSQGDSKSRQLQAWVATRAETLRWCIGREVRPIDVGEDRLRDVLAALSDDYRWGRIEAALNDYLIRTFAVLPERAQLVSAEGLCWQLTPEGLLQFHHGKTWRPGALRAQVTMTVLEPMGLPVATWIAPRGMHDGAAAIQYTQEHLPAQRIIYSGDSIAPVATRGAIHAGGDGYVCQLPIQHTWDLLVQHVSRSDPADGDLYEWSEPVCAIIGDTCVEWNERRILVRSRALARAEETALRSRLAQARLDLAALSEPRRGRQRPRSMDALQAAANDILIAHQTGDILRLSYHEDVQERTVRRYRGRPTAVRVERDMRVLVHTDEEALNQYLNLLGWRIYATNLNAAEMPADQIGAGLLTSDDGLRRLSGRPLSLTPGGLQQGEYTNGLIRLLALALRALTLLDIVAGRRLQNEAGERRLVQATGERLLDAFRDITLNVSYNQQPRYSAITPLTPLQRRILSLLALPPDIYLPGE